MKTLLSLRTCLNFLAAWRMDLPMQKRSPTRNRQSNCGSKLRETLSGLFRNQKAGDFFTRNGTRANSCQQRMAGRSPRPALKRLDLWRDARRHAACRSRPTSISLVAASGVPLAACIRASPPLRRPTLVESATAAEARDDPIQPPVSSRNSLRRLAPITPLARVRVVNHFSYELPRDVQDLARANYKLLQADPYHPTSFQTGWRLLVYPRRSALPSHADYDRIIS
jgi:hypothetical protein